jgi:periplasmic protein TonB
MLINPHMLTAKKKQIREDVSRSRRNRNLEAMVQPGHEELAGHADEADTFFSNEGSPDGNSTQSWDDIVFENRNREYGAYVVRKGYKGNLSFGLIVTLLVVTFALAYPFVVKWFGLGEEAVKLPPRKLVYTELSAPPPIDKPKPPPPQIILPRLQKVIKFVPPKVVKEQVVDTSPTITEIKENQTGATAVEGPTQVIFDEPVTEVVYPDDDELFTVVDQQPEYEGGYDAMMAFIKQNMKYPANARRMQIEGTVHVSFIVSKTGEISDVKVLRGIMTECDREAVRVVQMMPRWKPGKQNGRSVNVRFILPLKFRIN